MAGRPRNHLVLLPWTGAAGVLVAIALASWLAVFAYRQVIDSDLSRGPIIALTLALFSLLFCRASLGFELQPLVPVAPWVCLVFGWLCWRSWKGSSICMMIGCLATLLAAVALGWLLDLTESAVQALGLLIAGWLIGHRTPDIPKA